jgi:hypothetical protein
MTMSRFVPRTKKTKQLAVLLVTAIIYTCCFFYQLQFESEENAVYSAFWYSTPAMAFGAIALWWFAQGKKDE